MERLEWCVAVRASDLPASVKLTLLTHSEPGRRHFHDEQGNLHALARVRLAKLTGHDQRTVQRHLRQAEEAGWLQRHDGGHHGRQVRFHYTTPGRQEPCVNGCRREARGGLEGRQDHDVEGRQDQLSKGDKIGS